MAQLSAGQLNVQPRPLMQSSAHQQHMCFKSHSMAADTVYCPNCPADGTACEDGKFCTTGTTCQAGVCKGGQPTCTPDNSADCGATTVECSEVFRSCTFTTTNPCSSLNDQCNIGVCDSETNTCEKVPANNGNPCSDGMSCTINDKCNCGKCEGQQKVCTAPSGLDQCKRVVCSEPDGCKEVNKADGSPCQAPNSDKCSSDTCQAGVCMAGTANSCSQYDSQCTQGVCNDSTGKCDVVSKNGE